MTLEELLQYLDGGGYSLLFKFVRTDNRIIFGSCLDKTHEDLAQMLVGRANLCNGVLTDDMWNSEIKDAGSVNCLKLEGRIILNFYHTIDQAVKFHTACLHETVDIVTNYLDEQEYRGEACVKRNYD